MLPHAADHDLDGDIIRGLLRRDPGLDLVRLVDVGMASRTDPEVLVWAAREGRVLVTQDRNTMVGYAWDRVTNGLPMEGVLVRLTSMSIGQAIDELLVIASCGLPGDFRDHVRFLPL
jgi:predicted nuclease of predicted toxin-antitoxin system